MTPSLRGPVWTKITPQTGSSFHEKSHPDRRFEVSRRLKADFDNGRHYYDLHGTPVRLPRHQEALPSNEALEWHRQNRYLG